MRLQHVSLTFPPGADDEVRAFYTGVLGLREIPVPPKLDPGRFIWFYGGSGDLELHLMPGEVFVGMHHACLAVDDLDGLRERLETGGYEVSDTTEIVGRPRFFCRDPFGNLLELCRMPE
jgi:catechol 2,3-dioxygenase-like lactoylglutathione lyase family enzyme